MKLNALQIRGARGLPDRVDLTFGGCTVVYAPVGPTKSIVLEAIAAAKEHVGAYGVAGPALWPEHRGPARALLHLELDEEERAFAAVESPCVEMDCALGRPPSPTVKGAYGVSALLGRHTSNADGGKVELVPAERSLSGVAPGAGAGAPARTLSLSTHPKKYAGITDELVDLGRDDAAKLETVTAGFHALCKSVRVVGIERDQRKYELRFERDGAARLGFEALGLDEQQLLLFAALATVRMLRRSIVLIDAPELHLSESAAGELARQLPRLFGPENQIVIGTRSRAVAEAFDNNQVLHLGP